MKVYCFDCGKRGYHGWIGIITILVVGFLLGLWSNTTFPSVMVFSEGQLKERSPDPLESVEDWCQPPGCRIGGPMNFTERQLRENLIVQDYKNQHPIYEAYVTRYPNTSAGENFTGQYSGRCLMRVENRTHIGLYDFCAGIYEVRERL